MRVARQLDGKTPLDTPSLAVGLKRKQNQGAPGNLISIVRGKIRRFAALWMVRVEQTVQSVGPGHLGVRFENIRHIVKMIIEPLFSIPNAHRAFPQR